MFEVSVVEENIQGAIMPVRVLSGTKGEWCHVATVRRPPGRQRIVLSYFEPCRPFLPFFHTLGTKPINLYELVGSCSNPQNPASGWSSYVQIYSGVRFEVRRSAGRTTRVSQAPVDNQLMGTVDDVIRYAPIQVSVDTSSENDGSVLDIAYDCSSLSDECEEGCGCGNCQDKQVSSTDVYYLLRKSLSDIIVEVYDRSNCRLCASLLVENAIAVTDASIAACGRYIYVSLVSFESEITGVYVASIKDGCELTQFVKLNDNSYSTIQCCNGRVFFGGTKGAATAGCIDMISARPCSDFQRVLQTNQDVTIHDIDCCSDRVVAAGDNGFIASSRTAGTSWVSISAPTPADILSVSTNGSRMWIGTIDGKLWSREGSKWALVASTSGDGEIALTGQVEAGSIRNIEFVNKFVGYFTSGNQLFSTYSGGDYWETGCPRFEFSESGSWEQPDSSFYYTALAVPNCNDPLRQSNSLILGTSTSFSTGNHLVGEPLIEYGLPQVF